MSYPQLILHDYSNLPKFVEEKINSKRRMAYYYKRDNKNAWVFAYKESETNVNISDIKKIWEKTRYKINKITLNPYPPPFFARYRGAGSHYRVYLDTNIG
jgi:hypothetical protein